jgi:hypothetical protein
MAANWSGVIKDSTYSNLRFFTSGLRRARNAGLASSGLVKGHSSAHPHRTQFQSQTLLEVICHFLKDASFGVEVEQGAIVILSGVGLEW